IVVELHHMLEAGTDRRERIFEIEEGLLRLGAEIARRSDDLVVDVQTELAGNVDDPPGARGLHHVGISGWLPNRWRVMKAMDGHLCVPLKVANDGEAAIAEFRARYSAERPNLQAGRPRKTITQPASQLLPGQSIARPSSPATRYRTSARSVA